MLGVILLNTNKLEHSIKELFLKYLQNRATWQEIDRVLDLSASDEYEQEWQAALKELEAGFENNATGIELQNEEELYRRIKSRINQKKPYLFKWISYAAAMLLVSFISYQTFQRLNIGNKETEQQSAKVAETKPSGRKWLKLPDGTSVHLNTNSTLEYSGSFEGKNSREVTLIGEAFFDVAHDEAHPFLIHTGAITTKVLGTAFNISAYPDAKAITVTVARGKVMVRNESKTLAVLTPNQQLIWSTTTLTAAKTRIDAQKVVSWKLKDLIMDDITLEQAAGMLASRFKVTVLFKNEKVKRCQFTAAFLNRNDLSQVTDVLSNITGATFSLKGNLLTIDGAGCEN